MLKTMITGPISTNTYIIYQKRGNECAAIDPSDFNMVASFIDENKLTLTDILITHGHFDHIMSVADLKEKYGAKVSIHELDAASLQSERENLAIMTPYDVKPCKADVLLKDGDEIDAAGFILKVIHTPGHSKGGCCYVCEDEKFIFSGDTLFYLSVGRTDFPGCSARALFESINNKLFALEGDYRVYPGHDMATNLDFERKNNPEVKIWNEQRC